MKIPRLPLSNCPKCRDNPCTCGYVYETWTDDEIDKQIKMLSDVKRRPQRKSTNIGDHAAVIHAIALSLSCNHDRDFSEETRRKISIQLRMLLEQVSLISKLYGIPEDVNE